MLPAVLDIIFPAHFVILKCSIKSGAQGFRQSPLDEIMFCHRVGFNDVYRGLGVSHELIVLSIDLQCQNRTCLDF